MKKDRDYTKTYWYTYLRKRYGDKYRVFRDELGIWSIKCKYGFIQPYSIVKKELVAVLTYKSMKGINILLKNLQRDTDIDFRISQLGDYEVNIVFPENNLVSVSKPMKIYKKRHISEKERKRLSQLLKKAREAKN